MKYLPGCVPGPSRRPARAIPPPLDNGRPYFEVRYHTSKGRETPEPPEDPDMLPDLAASVLGPLAGRQLIDGDYGDEGASAQFAKRKAHNEAVQEFLGARVDIGEVPEDTAYCYRGDGEVHVYKRHPYEDLWELDTMHRAP